MIITAILAVLFLTCIICGFKSLKIAIDTIDASADFIAKTKRIILVPVLHFFIILVVFLVWLSAILCVYSMGDFKPDPTPIPQAKKFTEVSSKVTYMGLFMLFGLLWIVAFFNYASKFICMVAASTYYFDSNAEKEGEAEV